MNVVVRRKKPGRRGPLRAVEILQEYAISADPVPAIAPKRAVQDAIRDRIKIGIQAHREVRVLRAIKVKLPDISLGLINRSQAGSAMKVATIRVDVRRRNGAGQMQIRMPAGAHR